MMYQAQIPLGGLPIHLVLVGNKEQGQVVFVKVAPVEVIVENRVEGQVAATFDDEVFGFTDENGWINDVFSYNTVYDYKNIPLMLKWLQQQNLQQPA